MNDYQGLLAAHAHLQERFTNELGYLHSQFSAAEASKEESKQKAIK